MNNFSDFSIKSKLIIVVLSLLFLALSAFSTFILFFNYQYKMNALTKESKLQSELIADYAITPLLFEDRAGATDLLNKLESIPKINAAAIYDENGKLFSIYTQGKHDKTFSKTMKNFSDTSQTVEDEIIITTPIVYNDQGYGAVVFYISTADIPRDIFSYSLFLLLSMVILLVLSMFLISKMQNYITLPIIHLAKTAQQISLSEDYTIRAQKMYTDEVGRLYDDFNVMLERIEQRGRERDEAETISRTYQSHLERLTNELEERVKERTLELQESLDRLQSAQSQLVEAEKMSALGNLVAGVAHEVNTPLGISITAASIFKNEIKTIREMLAENRLSKSALEHFIDTISEADEILIKNLDRAALLVRNFKKISVDQSSEEIRDFELNTYLQEVISTFKNELKHRPIELKLELDEQPIKMHSYPGAISQIVVNMLQNALIHAFEPEEEGQIILSTQRKDESVIISFTDNGKGVNESVIHKIFEPFITTKRNKGGTGLGLNITYNLVTQHLGGTIHLDTEYNAGARFVMELPYTLN